MDEKNMGGGVWRPITLTCKITGRSINISILEREMYKSGFFTFDDLWQIYGAEDNPESGTEAGGDDNMHSYPVD